MARTINRLSAIGVKRQKSPGYYPDGGGLYLQVSRSGTKSWIFRYTLDGKAREMGLGSQNDATLEDARGEAQQCRKLLKQKRDPIAERNQARLAQRVAEAGETTFDDCAERYITAHETGWRNAKHAMQWRNTLETYASPEIGTVPVNRIDTHLILKILEPIWHQKTETATRIRGRIESILDWATAREYRQGENPARWRGHLDKLLPKRANVAKVRHHPALPYQDVGTFLMALRGREGVGPRTLEFIILTACRQSEGVNARWEELDLDNNVWTIPADRMKSGREQRVPLSAPARRILDALSRTTQSDYVFPGWKVGRPITGATCLKLVKDVGHPGLTVHGFRSTFRDWAAEQTNYPREVAEAALAHVISDKVEAAYRRGDLLERRARLMSDWAKYCGRTLASPEVVPLRAASRGLRTQV